MATSLPSRWPLIGPAVIIDASTAPSIRALLADGRRRAEREQWRLHPDVQAALRALDALILNKPPIVEPEPEPDAFVASGQWVDTDEAAALLRLSTRQVRRMTAAGVIRSKKVGGRLLIDACDAMAEADARRDALRTHVDMSGRTSNRTQAA